MDRLSSATAVGSQSVSFYPYGQDKGTVGANDSWKFATYWRDSATGLDYAMNRYYSSAIGRFLTPDPHWRSVKGNRPQSWNRYSYVLNDPINLRDRNGLEPEKVDCGDDDSHDCNDPGRDDNGGSGDDNSGDDAGNQSDEDNTGAQTSYILPTDAQMNTAYELIVNGLDAIASATTLTSDSCEKILAGCGKTIAI